MEQTLNHDTSRCPALDCNKSTLHVWTFSFPELWKNMWAWLFFHTSHILSLVTVRWNTFLPKVCFSLDLRRKIYYFFFNNFWKESVLLERGGCKETLNVKIQNEPIRCIFTSSSKQASYCVQRRRPDVCYSSVPRNGDMWFSWQSKCKLRPIWYHLQNYYKLKKIKEKTF